MKTLFAVAAAVSLMLLPTPSEAASAPKTLAGYTLGGDIAQVGAYLAMETALPIRYLECLEEVEIKNQPLFKSGLIAYGTCARPGKIVRIKMKYADGSRRFYDRLLGRFKTRFGEPSEWQGDPFHVVIDWKWSFVDDDGSRISLHLSHNSLDRDEKYGNAVKLTLSSAIDEEIRCYKESHPGFRTSASGGQMPSGGDIDWDQMVPR
jgi:hypothetical protein